MSSVTRPRNGLETERRRPLETLAEKSSNSRPGVASCYENRSPQIKTSCSLLFHGEKYFLEEKCKVFGGAMWKKSDFSIR